MGLLADRLKGIASKDGREQVIADGYTSKVPQGGLAERVARAAADNDIEARRQQRSYAEQAPPEAVAPVKEILTNLGDRRKVLGILRSMTPKQRDEVLKLAPGVAQGLGDDRGGGISRTLDAIGKGISHGVSQPLMELVGAGGTSEEIDYIRKLEAAAQEFSPARPDDPWYEQGPLQAAEMAPWMTTVAGAGGLGRAAATGVAGRLAARGAAAAGNVTANAVRGASAAKSGSTLMNGLTAGRAGELAGITAAAFPGQYAQEVDQLKSIGMQDGPALRMLAGGTATVVGLIEGLVPNPFKAGPVSLSQGAATAARQYLWEAAKRAPAEMSEEYFQGVASGLGQHVAQYIDQNAEDKSIGDAFKLGWEQAKEAALPMAFLLGVPAVGGAALSASRARLARLQELRSKGFISEDDAQKEGIEGKTRKERLANTDSEIAKLSQESQQEPNVPTVGENTTNGQTQESPSGSAQVQSVPSETTQPLPGESNGGQDQKPNPQFNPTTGQDYEQEQGNQTSEPAWNAEQATLEANRSKAKELYDKYGSKFLEDQYKSNNIGNSSEDKKRKDQWKSNVEANITANPAGVIKALSDYDSGDSTKKTQSNDPPIAEGMTRLYHGSATPDRFEGKAWFSTSKNYAENYRNNAQLQYVDVPTEWVNKQVDPNGYGQTVDKGFTWSGELDSSFTGPRKPISGQPTGATQKTTTGDGSGTTSTPSTPTLGSSTKPGATVDQASRPEGIPPLKPGYARVVHIGQPGNEESFKGGLDYSKSGMLQSTSRAWSDESKVEYDSKDPRFSGGTAYVYDVPESEMRVHGIPQHAPGKLPGKYYVGSVSPKQPKVDRPTTGTATKPGATVDRSSQHEGSAPAGDTKSNVGRPNPFPSNSFLAKQYSAAQETNPGKRLAFRMGDFYELYGEDAKDAAKRLGLTLTTRDRNSDSPVPMVGFPHHQYAKYAEQMGGDMVSINPELKSIQKQPETKWQSETRAKLDAVPALKGSKFDMDEKAGTVKVTRPDGFKTTVHFNSDEELAAAARAKGKDPKNIHGWYIRPKDQSEGRIYVRSDADHTNILNHEVMHWLQDTGVVTKEEIQQHGGIEAMATKYGEWVVAKQRKSNSVFQKVYDAFESLFSAQHRFFEEVGKRPAKTSKSEEPRRGKVGSVRSYLQRQESSKKPEKTFAQPDKPSEVKGEESKPTTSPEDFDAEMEKLMAEMNKPQSDKPPKIKGKKSESKEIKFSDLRKNEAGVSRTVNASSGDKTLLLELNKGTYRWSIREQGKSNDLATDIEDLRKAKDVAKRIFDGTFDKDAEWKFVKDGGANLAYSNAKLADNWEISRKDSFAALLRKTNYYTDARLIVRLNDKDRDDILAKAKDSNVNASSLKLDQFFKDGKELASHKDNKLEPVAYRGGDINPKSVLMKNGNGGFVLVDKALHDTVMKFHPTAVAWHGAERFAKKPGPVAYTVNGEVVGLVMPLAMNKIDKYLQQILNGEYVFEPVSESKPAPKIGKKKTPEEKSADDRAKAAAKREEAKRKMREAFNETQNKPTSLFNPEVGAKVAQAAKLYIEAGALDFRAFVRDLVEDFGKPWVEDKAQYLESAWRVANKFKWVDSPAGKVTDVLEDISNENNTGSTGDSSSATGARSENLEEGQTKAGEVADTSGSSKADNGGSRGLAGDGGRAEGKGSKSSGSTERGNEDVRVSSGPGGNYRIGQDERVGSGTGRGFSAKTRFAENVRAIRLLKQLEKEGRKATTEEQAILVKYVGWGGLKQAFGRGKLAGKNTVYEPIKGYESEFAELKALLTEDEWNSAKKSITNAHYTDPDVIRGVWQGIQDLGFKGGTIVEPSSGTGLFFGLVPQSILDNSATRLVGTEIDSVSGRIAQQLYQDADIRVQGFEELNLPDGSVDLFISNVPFGSYQLSDAKDKSIKTAAIHNFFFNKAIKKTRPGGLVVFITSRYSMDEKDASTREFWDKNGADLVGVVRLPGGAFKGIANTDVVTDVIILQKREDGAEPKHAAPWKQRKNVPQAGYLELVKRTDGQPGKIKVRNEGQTTFPVNEYFELNPSHVVGELAWTGTMQKTDENQVNVEPPKDGDIGGRVGEIIKQLPVNKESLDRVGVMTKQADESNLESIKSGEWKEDHLRVEGDRVYINDSGNKVEVPMPYGRHKKEKDVVVEIAPDKKGAARTAALVKVFNAAEKLIALQPTDATDKEIETARKQLNSAYDAAVKEYGPLSSGRNATFARMSLSVASRLFSLEEYDPTTDTAKKAAIFTERTERPHTFPKSANNAQDALTISLSQVGRLDPEHAANLVGKSVEATMEELGDLVFKNHSGDWELASTYLSGNVRQKLAEAKELAKDNKEYLRNVSALEAVQPKDLTPSQIEVRLGSPWIPTHVYEQFIDHLLRRTVKVSHSSSRGKWFLTPDGSRNDQLETLDFGIPEMPALEVITKSLNKGDMRVWESDGDGGRVVSRVVNRDKTTQVAAKLTKIKAEFARWLWDNPQRSDELTTLYNQEINVMHQEPSDGSHLTFPGMSDEVRNLLDPHQVNAVWRYITGGNMLLGHVVGAGKSWTMAAAAMEQKRISGNPSYKTMIAVPNHLVTSGQFVKEIYEAYPSAKVLAATPDSLSGIGRRSLLKKIATGNYDIIVIAHTSFGMIPLNPSHESDFIQKQIDELEVEIRTARADKDRSYEAELQTMIDNLRDKLKKMSSAMKRDELSVYFDDLNINSLFVDEAHEFKNLSFRTRMSRVPGVNPSGSAMAFDMWMKTTYFNQATNEKTLLFATGTPIANAIAEMYTMQRYLQPSILEKLGLQHFDSWAAAFADEVTKPEIDPAGGGMRMHSRLSQYINMPELSAIFRQVADVQTADMLVDVLKRPLIQGGKPEAVKAERNAILEEIIDGLQERARRVRSGAVDKSTDNMLNIVTDGRKAATDIRLIDPTYPDLKGSKVNLMVENVHRIWKETADKKSTQLIWLDVTSPNTDYSFNLYHDIVDKLVSLGIPREEIAIMHDYNEKTKAQLFRSMNNGDIRILLGSTGVMGTGVNVQKRLIANHHLDVPWRPDQLEQRDGRILRRGNTNKEVRVIRYISKGSFDSFMWDKIEQKTSFIRAAMSGASDRVLDASEAEDMSAAEMKAAAADDPNLIRYVTVQAEVNKLESEYRGFIDEQSQIRRGISSANYTIERSEKDAEDFAKLVEINESLVIPDGEIRAEIGKTKYTDPKAFGEALTNALVNAPKGQTVRFKYNGLDVAVSQDWNSGPESFYASGWIGKDTGTYNASLKLGDSPSGNITRLNNAVEKMKDLPEQYREQAKNNRLKIAALEKRITDKWPDSEKLVNLREEQATLAGLVQSSGSDEHKKDIAERITKNTGRKVVISEDTGRYLWKDVPVRTDLKTAIENEKDAVVQANFVDAAEGQLTAERNAQREARLQQLRAEAEVYQWDRSVNPRPPKKKAAKKSTKNDDAGESRRLDEFTSPELQDRQSMGAAKVRISSAADLVGEDEQLKESKYASPNKEFERRWSKDTSGLGKSTLAERLREFWGQIVKSTVRGSLTELPRSKEFGEARSAMHAYQNSARYAQIATEDLLKKTVKPLSPSDYDLFCRVVIMRDQVEAAANNERLSFGLTPETAKEELDRVEALAANNERVQASLEYRKQWTEAMTQDYLDAHEYLGMDMNDRFQRENYFRHQVLHYYTEDKKRGLGKKKVELTTNRAWMKGRTSGEDLGEEFDLNTNYLQAEWEVSTQMIADTKRAQAIGRIKRYYDKMQKLKEEAKHNNYVAVVGGQDVMDEIEELRGLMAEMEAQDSLDSGEKAQMKAWSERLWELDPTMPFRRDMAIARDKIERGASSIGEEVPADFMRYVSDLAKQDFNPLQPYALQFLKAVSDRKAFIKNQLGDQYQTWEDVVPDDHEEVAIRPGRAMFQAYSVQEQIASELMADLSKTIGINADSLRSLTALGAKYTPLVVPTEVAAQMAAVDNKLDFGWLDRIITKPMNAWKKWRLQGPTNVIKYNLRNLSEVDKVLSLNPDALSYVPQAFKDLWKLYSGDENIPSTIRDWVERGGTSTLVRVNELGDINKLKEFASLIADKKSGISDKLISAPVDLWRKYWSVVGIGSDMRESILRYAAYLSYLKQLESGKLTNYGGSVRSEVDGIKDNKDKAMRLSADLLGDYSDISLVGQFLRSRLAPFWSFQETNVRTYFRGLINLASNEQSAIKAGMQIARSAGIGALAKAPFLAYKLGRIAILFYGLQAMATVFNQMWAPDDDDELPEDEKKKAHLTFGRNSKGEVMYFSRIGTAADVLDWIGLDSVDYDLRDVLDGRRTVREVMLDMAKSPVDKSYGMLSPFIKAPTELAVGQTAYPNVGKPRPIRDRGKYIAQTLGLSKEYDRLMGNPTTPMAVSDYFIYKVEPGTSAYYMTEDAKARWLKTARNRGVGYSESVKGDALRSYKMALRLKDKTAADKYLAIYEASGGNKDGLMDSLESSHPAGGLSTLDAFEFYKSLSPIEKEEYKKAEQFYYSELLTEEQAKEIRHRREKRLHDMAFGKNKDGSPKGKPEKKPSETNTSYRKRLEEWQNQRKTAREALEMFKPKQ